jgi:hypothetical protein
MQGAHRHAGQNPLMGNTTSVRGNFIHCGAMSCNISKTGKNHCHARENGHPENISS